VHVTAKDLGRAGAERYHYRFHQHVQRRYRQGGQGGGKIRGGSKKRREEIDVRNGADQMIYQCEKRSASWATRYPRMKSPGYIEDRRAQETLKGTDINAIKSGRKNSRKFFTKFRPKFTAAGAVRPQGAPDNGEPPRTARIMSTRLQRG
jgi:molecular chaperone DnaK